MAKPRQSSPRWQGDYLLVQRYLQGDQAAWDILYKKAYPSARTFLGSLYSKDRLPLSERPEILDEAFARCQAHAARFEGHSNFSTWVYGYVRFIAMNTVKKRVLEDKKVIALQYLYRTKNSAASPEDILIRRERDRYLWLAYHSLPLYHKVLIGYLVLEQYSYWETRHVTGLHMKTDMEAALPNSLAVLRRYYLSLYRNYPDF